VRIHTSRRTTKAGYLSLGSGRPIWNIGGDAATLIDPNNVTVSRYRYRRTLTAPFFNIEPRQSLESHPTATARRTCIRGRQIGMLMNGEL
jgi:hypothetical protein